MKKLLITAFLVLPFMAGAVEMTDVCTDPLATNFDSEVGEYEVSNNAVCVYPVPENPDPFNLGASSPSHKGGSGKGSTNWCDQPGETTFCRPRDNTALSGTNILMLIIEIKIKILQAQMQILQMGGTIS